MDLLNNEIIAYKLYDHQQTPLVIDTLKTALTSAEYPEGVTIHSDQGKLSYQSPEERQPKKVFYYCLKSYVSLVLNGNQFLSLSIPVYGNLKLP
ncbi:hypothetical protein HYG86_12620 [Alkalicella caledoniensis]|uniref:Integrase catalytic domain-containing protein n=1 Tax=Alkalicella caledoniensis TaxID=2731377 RepID=A0A7G9WA41_ALKCA|nr:hypothetical protein [Alkalicella caledoniensis]QNO15553.1 hypothetical protein HYG86_12620 [Alkalicella caledoniensis]